MGKSICDFLFAFLLWKGSTCIHKEKDFCFQWRIMCWNYFVSFNSTVHSESTSISDTLSNNSVCSIISSYIHSTRKLHFFQGISHSFPVFFLFLQIFSEYFSGIKYQANLQLWSGLLSHGKKPCDFPKAGSSFFRYGSCGSYHECLCVSKRWVLAKIYRIQRKGTCMNTASSNMWPDEKIYYFQTNNSALFMTSSACKYTQTSL